MAGFAGDTIRRNKELWTTGETVGEPPGHAGCRRSQWKKPDIHHRALPSCDRGVGKTYGFRRRARNKGPVAESGGKRRQAVSMLFVIASASALSRLIAQLLCDPLTLNYQKCGRSGREQPAVFVQ